MKNQSILQLNIYREFKLNLDVFKFGLPLTTNDGRVMAISKILNGQYHIMNDTTYIPR